MAYADFVTAMMALFMVLWISAQDKEILIATSSYFQNPFRSPMDATSGVLPFKNSKPSTSQGKDQGQGSDADRDKHIQMTFLNSVAADFYRMLHLDANLENKPIEIQVTSDGLRVTLFDRSKQPFFVRNSTELTEWGTFVLQNMAWTIERHNFKVTIDGHVNGPVNDKPNYTSWELSADRANTARRTLVHYAVDPAQIERVTGYDDTRPAVGDRSSEVSDRVTLNLTLTAKARPRDTSRPEWSATPTREAHSP